MDEQVLFLLGGRLGCALIEYAGSAFSGIGSLAIGNIKSQADIGLFKHIQAAEETNFIGFTEAYEFAVSLVKDIK